MICKYCGNHVHDTECKTCGAPSGIMKQDPATQQVILKDDGIACFVVNNDYFDDRRIFWSY